MYVRFNYFELDLYHLANKSQVRDISKTFLSWIFLLINAFID